jgi:hypothetical protein
VLKASLSRKPSVGEGVRQPPTIIPVFAGARIPVEECIEMYKFNSIFWSMLVLSATLVSRETSVPA